MRTFLFSIVFGFSMLLVFPVASYAAGIVPCDGVAVGGGVICQTCHFIELGSNILNWIVGIMATVCAVVIAVAGLKMATAGGDAGAVSSAKEMIKNAIVGFIILLAAWLIVDTVMRVFVGDQIPNFGPWNEIQCVAPDQVYPEVTPTTPPPTDACATASNPDACRCEAQGGTWNLGTGMCEGVATTSPPTAGACASGPCVALNTPCTNGCTVDSSIVARINAFHAAVVAAGVGGTRVTEAMPPSSTHRAACHQNGTCIDYSRSGGMTAAQINTVADAARANGLRPVYEVSTAAQRTALIDAGANPANIIVVSAITAPHFSIYGN
jgi:hypothetical protein